MDNVDDVDAEVLAAMEAEMDRLLPAIRRQDAMVSLAANAPRIAGQLHSAAAAGNWWAFAGWTLRAVEVVLLEVGHLRHDAAHHQAALEYWGRAQRAARAAAPDDDQLSERAKVLGQWSDTRRDKPPDEAP